MHFKKLPANDTDTNRNIQRVFRARLRYFQRHVGMRNYLVSNAVDFIAKNQAILHPGLQFAGMQRNAFRCLFHDHNLISRILKFRHRRYGVGSSTRASGYLYTTEDEIDRFLDALAGVRAFFGEL